MIGIGFACARPNLSSARVPPTPPEAFSQRMILFIFLMMNGSSKYHSYQEYIHIETESRCIKDMLGIDKSVNTFLVPSGHRRNRDRNRDDRDQIKLQPSISTSASYSAYRIQEKLLIVTYSYHFLTLAAFSDLLMLSLMLSFHSGYQNILVVS